jgi:hypothetical protein
MKVNIQHITDSKWDRFCECREAPIPHGRDSPSRLSPGRAFTNPWMQSIITGGPREQDAAMDRRHNLSEEELQNWVLLPDAFAAEEFERIGRIVESCELYKVYCELVRRAEKDVEDHLETEAGRDSRQRLLDQVSEKCVASLTSDICRDPQNT